MILLICMWNWPFMEEQKSTAGKGAEWGAIIVLSRLLYFHNRWRLNLNRNWISINCTALIYRILISNVCQSKRHYYNCFNKPSNKTLNKPSKNPLILKLRIYLYLYTYTGVCIQCALRQCNHQYSMCVLYVCIFGAVVALMDRASDLGQMQRTHFTAGYTLYNCLCDK